MTILNTIFLNLCKYIYPLVPKLYATVETLATIDIFDPNHDGTGSGIITRNQIWNNLYVILSVLVLFAIAIKLINAIVNPDVLSDKKKGVKNAYMKAVISVFLIILLPMLFNLLQSVQNEIIENHFIQRMVYGQEVIEEPGQVLAIETARSFVEMAEGIDNPFETHANDIKSALDELDDNDAAKDTAGEYVKEFNPFLMLVSGIFVVYELILIVMDTAVRTIKLRILELMVPAIIGGYIFKTEILKAWFKEYIKTFVQVFLLIVTITLISVLLGFLKSATNEQWNWVIRLLLIFGVLTIAKQIPNLINTIFGTNIKGKGGIKGRLGEMAAVGGLAQQALGALKPLGMGLAKGAGLLALGAGGAVGLGLGAAGVGLGKKFWWDKGGKDSKPGRALRRVGAGAKAFGTGVVKGAGKKGGLIASLATGISEGAKSWSNSEIGKSIKAEKEAQRANVDKNLAKSKFRFGDNNRSKEITELEAAAANGDITTKQLNGKRKKAAEANQKRAMSDAKATFDGTKNVKMRGSDKILAGEKKVSDAAVVSEHFEGAKKKYGDYNGKWESAIQEAYSSGNDVLGDVLKEIHGNALGGKLSVQDKQKYLSGEKTLDNADGKYKVYDNEGHIKSNVTLSDLGLSVGAINGINADYGGFSRGFNAEIELSNGQKTSVSKIVGGNGQFVISTLGKKAEEAATVLSTAEAGIEETMAELGYNETQKGVVKSVTDKVKRTAKEVYDANSAYGGSEEEEAAYHGYTPGSYSSGANSGNGSSGGTQAPSPQPAPQSSPAQEQAPAPQQEQTYTRPGGSTVASEVPEGYAGVTSQPTPAPTPTGTSGSSQYWDNYDYNSAPSIVTQVPEGYQYADLGATPSSTQTVVKETHTETKTTETKVESGGTSGSSEAADYGSSSSSSSSNNSTVTANVDMSGINSALKDINNSVNAQGKAVADAVSTQGQNITDKLDAANTTMTNVKKKTDEIKTEIGDMSSSNKPGDGTE